jgi:hypothetical protein
MAGNEYGPRGGASKEETDNRAIEERILVCLKRQFGSKYPDYGCISENHSTQTLGNLSSRRVQATRDISVRLGNFQSGYIIKYNTANGEYTVKKQSKYAPDLSEEDIQMAIHCITSNQEGGRRRSKTNRYKARKSRRKFSRRRL